MFFCSFCNYFKVSFLIFSQPMFFSSFFMHDFAFLIVMILPMGLYLSFIFSNFYFSILFSFLSSIVINFSIRTISMSILATHNIKCWISLAYNRQEDRIILYIGHYGLAKPLINV